MNEGVIVGPYRRRDSDFTVKKLMSIAAAIANQVKSASKNITEPSVRCLYSLPYYCRLFSSSHPYLSAPETIKPFVGRKYVYVEPFGLPLPLENK